MRPARWRVPNLRKENRGWNRQDAKSAKVSLFSFPLRPLRLCGSNLRNRQSGPSTKRARIYECTNAPGPVAQGNRGWNRQDAKSAKVFFFFFPLRPLRLCGSNLRDRQSGPSTKRARIHECVNAPGPVAQGNRGWNRQDAKSARVFFFSFLCGLCAFAVQIFRTAKAGRPRSGCECTNARIRPARWRKEIAVGTAKTPRARRFSSFLCVFCAFAVQISRTAKAGRPRSGREYTNARMRPAPTVCRGTVRFLASLSQIWVVVQGQEGVFSKRLTRPSGNGPGA